MDVPAPSKFPAHRTMQFISAPSSIDAAWDRSQHTLDELSRRMNSERLHPAITTVYVAGSIGRMEQLSNSDADVVVIVADDVDPGSPVAIAARDAVWQELVEIGLPRPKATGVFARVDTAARLRDPSTRGVIDEDMGAFGRRFQMLLDSQPIYATNTFLDLRSAVIDRYVSDRVATNSSEQWTYLLNDLIRYWRSLCVRTQWIESPGEWRLINTKLRHSRLMNYAGLLLLLGECSYQSDTVGWLKQRMRWTPLERVAAAFATYDDPSIDHITTAYDRFLAAMDNETTRVALIDSSNEKLETSEYLMLKQNSDAILRNLLGFVMRRTGDWSERFFECLIF
ncbi:MAG: hypothetical protein CMJ64_22395 [Planctomycetaceae bacterium]|nr:hypothetical protein [Planctomycetaceae bacterium]